MCTRGFHMLLAAMSRQIAVTANWSVWQAHCGLQHQKKHLYLHLQRY